MVRGETGELFRHVDTLRRQLSETQETLNDAVEYVNSLSEELKTTRFKATDTRHENYAMVLKVQELEAIIEKLQA